MSNRNKPVKPPTGSTLRNLDRKLAEKVLKPRGQRCTLFCGSDACRAGGCMNPTTGDD